MPGGDFIILDVRTEEKYNERHIEGAVLLPNEDIGETQPELLPDKNTDILIYCRSGRRSREAAEKLVSMGYMNVYDFGGINDWPYAALKETEEEDNLTGEYPAAVHALVFLNHMGCCVNSEALAENICTNPARVRKIMAKLKRAGLVKTREGADGGYIFGLDPKKVNICDVLEAVGDQAVPVVWRSGDPHAGCFVSSGMAGIMDEITSEMDALCRVRLSEITIDDIDKKIFVRR